MSEASFFRKEESGREIKPRYRFMVTRHAERLPDGSLRPEGIEKVTKKGKKLGESAQLVKGYASDEETKRTVLTSKYISNASETNSPLTNKPYEAREVEDIQYNSVLKPDLTHVLKEASRIIDEATINELGLPEGTVLKELPKDEQLKIAPIRQKNQDLGFRSLLKSPEAVHRMAMGMSAQLTKEMGIAERYNNYLEKRADRPLKKDAILNTNTHGMFSESLFLEAGYIKDQSGTERKINQGDFETPEFGGFIMPSESFALEIDDPANIPDKIPVSFEKDGRPKDGAVVIDKKRLLELAEEYKKWRENSHQNE